MNELQVEKLSLVRHTVKTKAKWFTLFAFGDVHLGHKDCDIKAAKKMVDYIASKPITECAVILTGDLVENVLPSTKGSLFDMSLPSPDDQIEAAVSLVKPMAKHILMLCDGNHEDRTQRTAGITISKIVARELGVRYVGYHGATELALENNKETQKYTIYAEHGCGSIPKAVAGRYSKMEAIQKQVEADVYLKGHIHHKIAFPKHIWKNIKGRMIKRKVMFASNGSYLQDAEYAIRSGFEPTQGGVAKVLLSTTDFNIHCSI